MSELDRYFIYKCRKGLEAHGLAGKEKYEERLQFEIDTIVSMKFPGYFLVVQDIINWAKSQDIYVGPGRGSAAGSLASYCLGITNLDPIKWDLLFERFLNPDRISMPDIDIDFEERFRDRVFQYAIDKYGTDHAAHIGTFGTMKAKKAIKSVTKTLGHPYALGDALTKQLLGPLHGKPQPLKESIEKVKELHDYRHSESTQGEILKWAEKVEGMVSNIGVHACGLVIANDSLIERVPMFVAKDGELTTQWSMETIEDIGLIKFDFLGLDALTKIHLCVELVEQLHGIKLDPDELPLDDELTFEKLRAGETAGIFQLEASSGIRDLIVQIRPTSVEDLIAAVAIYRPGPLGADYKNIYMDVRAGKREPEYLVPELEPILKRTDGWLIYQEQCMEIAKQICGYTGGQADDLRKAIGKKIPEKMAAHEEKIKEGWKAAGLSSETGDQLWEEITAFAAYGFNRSHAAAYAMVTYQTAYLKAHYPTEYMCAVMMSVSGDQDKTIKCIAECKRLGIKVLPPDINKSRELFTVIDDKEIRFGLGPIKNIGMSAQAILEERNEFGKFTGLRNFCERVDLGKVNRGKLESLIKAGAFDCFDKSRSSMLQMVELIWEYRNERKRHDSKKLTFEKKLIACEQRLEDIENGVLSDKGKKLKPLKEPPEPVPPEWPEAPELDEMPELELQLAEHELLGFYVSSHPLDSFVGSSITSSFNSVEDIKMMARGEGCSLACVISNLSEITTRKKAKMAFLKLEDLSGSIEAVCFPGIYARTQSLLTDIRPLRVDGKVEITETDENRVTKIIISRITVLDPKEIPPPAILEVDINLSRAKDVTELINKYSGNVHEVYITLVSDDGTRFNMPSKKIGNYRGSFMRDIVELKNDQYLLF